MSHFMITLTPIDLIGIFLFGGFLLTFAAMWFIGWALELFDRIFRPKRRGR